jgi:hypothetical protein
MPVMKCSTGEWKIGNDGDCRYSTKEDAEAAQQAYYASKNESVELDEEVRPRTGGVYSSWVEAYYEAVQNYMPDTEEELRKFTSWWLHKNGGGARMHEDRIRAEMEEMIQNMQSEVTESEGDEQEGNDVISMDHSFLLRILELMREYEGMDDVLLHKVADRIIEKGDTVTMDDYDDIVQDLDPEKAGYSSKYGNDEMEEEVLKSPQDWDDGDRGPVTDDPEHQGKRELDELDMLLRWSGQKR